MLKLTRRDFSLKDSDLILTWRNNPNVRKFSRNSDLISKEQHQHWLTSQILVANSRKKISVFEFSGRPIGMVRIDELENEYKEINVLVEEEYQGQGIATQMLRDVISSNGPSKLIATIHEKNIASRKLFENLGFKLISKEDAYFNYQLISNDTVQN